MQDFRFSKPANRAVFRQSIARLKAHHPAKPATKFVPPVHVNGAFECDDPMAPGASVGLPSEPCLFPQPWLFPPVFLGTGGDLSLDEYRPEFRFSVVTGAFGIDAPSRLPAGGHRLIDLGRIAIVEPSCGRA